MAKNKQVQVIEIDVLTKGLDTAEKNFKSLVGNTGELGKRAELVIKQTQKIRDLISEYGDEIPLKEAKELSTMLKKISEYSNRILSIDDISIFNEEELKRVTKINSQLDLFQKKLRDLEKNKPQIELDARSKRDTRINELKSQKTATNADGKSVSLKSIEGSWNSKKDLQNIMKKSTVDSAEYKAAEAVIYQINKAQIAYNDTLKETEEEITKLENKIKELAIKKSQVSASGILPIDDIKSSAEDVAAWADNMKKSVDKAVESNQKMGNTAISTSKGLDKQASSFGTVVKAVFSWTAVWNLGKRLYREAIRTIREMDESLNGMAMVTGKSREEIEQLVPRIQSLAKETSTAMTEIAGLITEYTKQGRTLEESFILAEETAKAAKIAGISAAESIQYMTSAINGFNLAATDATRVSDVFANIAAISATDYEQLAIALSKVSAQANLAGMSIEYTTALLAKGIETTQEAPESIGTALKTIVARMRELSDYGKTLEDGASVNKVESALAAAGIKLRDVNGEFRDLEAIFNELGPKWDHLNTMQQQAIAQAVAGTRQQSRFVAIMQDWERTQELAAEAQDSAGASAAQYAVLAEGMAAAMTNLNTSWQEFTQSLVNSKVIIGIVNTFTKGLEGVTNLLEKGGDTTKNLFAILTGLVVITTARHKAQQALGIETDKEVLMNVDALKLESDKLKAEQERLATETKILEVKRQNLELDEQTKQQEIFAASNSLSKLESELEQSETDDFQYYTDGEEGGPSQRTIQLQEEVRLARENLSVLESQYDTIHNNLVNATNTLNSNKSEALELDRQAKTAEEEYYAACAAINNPLASRTAMLQKQLKLEKDRADAEIKYLKSLKQEEATSKRIQQLTKQSQSLGTRINLLEKQKNKILTKGSGIMVAMASTLGTGIESSLHNILNKLGPIGDLLEVGLNHLLNWGLELVLQTTSYMAMNKFKKEANKLDNEALTSKTLLLATSLAEAKSEDEVTDEKRDQLKILTAILAERKLQIPIIATEVLQEKAVGKEKDANLVKTVASTGAETTNTLVKAAGSAASIPVIGWIIAAAILAAVGVGAAAIAAGKAAQANSDAGINKSIANNQNNIYNTKKENNSLQATSDELEALMSKKYQTEEDKARIEEIVSSLKEENEDWQTLSNNQILKELKNKIILNTSEIARATIANYELASKLEDFSSQQSQQAIEDKMNMDQQTILQNYGYDKQISSQLTTSLNNMTERFVQSNAQNFEKMLATEDTYQGQRWRHFADYLLGPADSIVDAVSVWSSGDGFWKGLGELFFSPGGWIDSESAKQAEEAAKQEREKFNLHIKTVNEGIVRFAVGMESAGDNVIDQALMYNRLMQSASEEVQAVARAEYDTIDTLSNIIEDTGVRESLEKLTSAGILSSEALLNIVNAATGVANQASQTKQQASEYQNQSELFEKTQVGVANRGELEKEYSLDELAEELGLVKGQYTALELQAAFEQKYGKFNDKGELKTENDGDYRWKGDNDVRTAQYKIITGTIEALGDNANKTSDQLKELGENSAQMAEYYDSLEIPDVTTAVQDFILNLEDAVSDIEQMPTEGGSAQVQLASKAIVDEGYALMDSLSAGYEESKQQQQDQIKTLEEELKLKEEAFQNDKNNAQAEEEYYQALNNVNNAMSILNDMTSNYDKALKELEESTLKAAGYLSSLEGDELLVSVSSRKNTIQDLYGGIGKTDSLTAEDYAFIRDELAKTGILKDVTTKLGLTDYSVGNFYDDLKNGSTVAYQILEELYNNIGDYTVKAYDRSIGASEGVISKLESKASLTEEEQIQLANEKIHLETLKAQQKDAVQYQAEALGLSKDQLRYQNAKNKLAIVENDTEEQTLDTLNKQLEARANVMAVLRLQMEKELDSLANNLKIAGVTKDQLAQYIKVVNGKMLIDEKWYNALHGSQKQAVDNYKDLVEEMATEYHELLEQSKQDIEEFYEEQFEKAKELIQQQIDAQNKLLGFYKDKLQEEQEALQKSLDKRKEMYEKYYDSLEEQESDEDFEEQQAKLQRAIASLATASDGASLAKRKELQQQLEELEEEQLSTERERRRENVMATLDNESEIVDEYYSDLLEDNRRLWEDIKRMDALQIHKLMTTYNEEWKNGTDEQRKIIDMENMEIYKQFPELANMSKEEIEAKYEAMKKAFIEDAGLSTQPIKDSIKDIETAFINMIEDILAKLKDEDKNDDNDNSSGTNSNSAPKGTPDNPIIVEPSEEPSSPRATAGGVFSQRGGHQVIVPYSTGGYVDYTGLAMVHGSQTKPEAFLNTSQTAMFADLATTLEAIYSRPSNYADEYDDSGEVVIENLTIAVDASLTNDNIPEIGQSLADALFDGIRRSGYNINTKK